MLPELFSVGPITIHAYGLIVAIGFLAGIIVAVRLGRRSTISQQEIMDLVFLMAVSAIAGSRIFYIIINISYYKAHPMDAFKIWEGGLVFSGGVVAAGVALVFYTKRKGINLFRSADTLAPAVALGQSIGRVGCLLAGCCYGAPTNLPWAVTFTNPNALAPLHAPLHPTQIYSSLIGAAIFVILLILYRRKRYDGQVALWFLILQSTGRLFEERFRGDDRGFISEGMSATQLLALIILVLSVTALIFYKRKNSISEMGKKPPS